MLVEISPAQRKQLTTPETRKHREASHRPAKRR